jgi:hypothetical protein
VYLNIWHVQRGAQTIIELCMDIEGRNVVVEGFFLKVFGKFQKAILIFF